jgi:hypothetical protein
MSYGLTIGKSGLVPPFFVFTRSPEGTQQDAIAEKILANSQGTALPKSLVNRTEILHTDALVFCNSLRLPLDSTDRDVSNLVLQLMADPSVGLQLLGETAMGINTLNLTNCANVTDESLVDLEQLCRSMPTLKRISLSGTAVSDRGIQLYRNSSLFKLDCIDLAHCFNVTPGESSKASANVNTEGCGVRQSRGVVNGRATSDFDDDWDSCGTALFRTKEIWERYRDGTYRSPQVLQKWTEPMVGNETMPRSGLPWSIT